jgi:hypothetical protein
MNFNIFGSPLWSITNIAPPWNNRPSIYWHILNHLQEDSCGLREGGEELPDEKQVRGDSQIGWAAGALDGVFGHHGGSDEAVSKKVQEILQAIRDLIGKASDKNAAHLYSLLLENNTLSFVDPLLEAITTAEKLDHGRLHTVALWLAMEAADREVVKTAISILGLFQGNENRDVLMTLGKHEEFTLYSVVALQNTQDDPENALWQLAQHVRGWGRIHILERLSETKDQYIKDWLLREGYQNEIMYEYTALICAQTGELHQALQQPEVDEELLQGAGAILSTLIDGRGGGPAEGIESYENGAVAIESYLEHLSNRDNDLAALVNIDKIERFLKDEENGVNSLPESFRPDWISKRDTMFSLIKIIKSQSGWLEKTREGLQAEERMEFWTATEAAKILGLEVWEIYFEKIQQGEDYWWNAMQTNDPDKIDLIVEFAERTFPLEEIAVGPGDEIGLGEAFQAHQKLDWVLQDLRRFPGKGWRLIKAGLQSPVIRNRNMAVNALSAWDRKSWTTEVESLFRRAYEAEPNKQTRELMKKVLDRELIA